MGNNIILFQARNIQYGNKLTGKKQQISVAHRHRLAHFMSLGCTLSQHSSSASRSCQTVDRRLLLVLAPDVMKEHTSCGKHLRFETGGYSILFHNFKRQRRGCLLSICKPKVAPNRRKLGVVSAESTQTADGAPSFSLFLVLFPFNRPRKKVLKST